MTNTPGLIFSILHRRQLFYIKGGKIRLVKNVYKNIVESIIMERRKNRNVCTVCLEAGVYGIEKNRVKKDRISLKPFISIWLKPRETIGEIVQRDSSYMVNFITSALVVLPAIRVSLSDFTSFSGFISSLSLNIVFGAISISTGLYLWGLLLTFVGQKIDGKGVYRNVIAVIVWSTVPLLCLELFSIMAITIIRIFPGVAGKGYIIVYRSITGLMILWSLFIGTEGLSEVHKIPLGKSFRCLFISFLIVAAFLFLLGYMLGLIR